MHLLAFAEAPIQLFPDGTIFIHIAMILLMIYILNRTFYRPINRILETRERNKGGHSTEADTILAEADSKRTSYNKELLDARSEGYELIASEHKRAAEDRAKKLETAKSDINAKFEAERAELERQRQEAHAAIGTEADKMAEQITTNILGK